MAAHPTRACDQVRARHYGRPAAVGSTKVTVLDVAEERAHHYEIICRCSPRAYCLVAAVALVERS